MVDTTRKEGVGVGVATVVGVGLSPPDEEVGVGVATVVGVGVSPPEKGEEGVGVATLAVGISPPDEEGEGVDPAEGAGVVRPIIEEGARVGVGVISSDVSTSIIIIAKSAEPRLVSSQSPCVNPANTSCPLDEVAAARNMSELAVPSCTGKSRETHHRPAQNQQGGGGGLAKGGHNIPRD